MFKHTKHLEELNFTVLANVSEYYVTFVIHDMHAEDVDEIYLHGSVKWDGCSNWYFDEQDRNMLHGCDKADLQRLGIVMAFCWDWTVELCQKSMHK
jgi:hypothetical protein